MALASDLVQVSVVSNVANFLGDTMSASLSATGTTQGTALALVSSINEVTTVTAGVNDGVILPAVITTPYSKISIRNGSAANLQIYPASGQSINALAANAAYVLAATTGIMLCKISSSRWVTI